MPLLPELPVDPWSSLSPESVKCDFFLTYSFSSPEEVGEARLRGSLYLLDLEDLGSLRRSELEDGYRW